MNTNTNNKTMSLICINNQTVKDAHKYDCIRTAAAYMPRLAAAAVKRHDITKLPRKRFNRIYSKVSTIVFNTHDAEMTGLYHVMFEHDLRLAIMTGNAARKEQIAAYKALVNHRAPVVGKIDFSSIEYHAAVIVAAGKVNSARRRGVADNNNWYLQHFYETVQEAALALQEVFTENERFYSLMPAGYDMDTTALERFAPYEETPPARYAARACGRLAYSYEKRAQEFFSGAELKAMVDKGAAADKVDRARQERTIDARKISGSLAADNTERAADRDYLNTWKKRAALAVSKVKTSRRNKMYLLMTLDGKADKTPRPVDYRKLLDKVLRAAGLLSVDVRGHRMLTDNGNIVTD